MVLKGHLEDKKLFLKNIGKPYGFPMFLFNKYIRLNMPNSNDITRFSFMLKYIY